MRTLCGSLILAFCTLACGGGESSGTRAPTRKAEPAQTKHEAAPVEANRKAIALLDDYVAFGRDVAAQGKVEPSIVTLEALEVRARTEGTQGAISEDFTRRYLRLVRVTRLMIQPVPDGVSNEQARDELRRFVKDVTGEDRDISAEDGLAVISPALVDEAIELHALVDGTGSKDAAKKKYKTPASP